MTPAPRRMRAAREMAHPLLRAASVLEAQGNAAWVQSDRLLELSRSCHEEARRLRAMALAEQDRAEVAEWLGPDVTALEEGSA